MTASLNVRNVTAALIVAALLLLPLYTQLSGNMFVLTLFTRIVIFALAAVSLNLIMGYGGMMSFGHAAYLGIGGYAVAQSGVLALRSPIFLMYFVVLAGRPVASSVRKAALISILAVAEYSILLIWLWSTNRVPLVINPIDAVNMARVTPLDETERGEARDDG